MGFKTGATARVWDVRSKSPKVTDLRVTTSAKNKQTDQWEDDFTGYVACIGACASKAAQLKKGDRIKVGDFDITYKYDKDKEKGYTNIRVFSFEPVSSDNNTATRTERAEPKPEDGEPREDFNGRRPPF